MDYSEFLEQKAFSHVSAGFECESLPYPLFDYQAPIVRWALKRGKAAIFADTGLGKTIMQLSWADQVSQHTNGPVILLAPLAVADQTIEEGKKYGIQGCRMRIPLFPFVCVHPCLSGCWIHPEQCPGIGQG